MLTNAIVSQNIILCERIVNGMIKLRDRSISEHLACFLINFPRPLFEVKQSMGKEKFEQVKRQAMKWFDDAEQVTGREF